jgi:serine O-acetyltransferase
MQLSFIEMKEYIKSDLLARSCKVGITSFFLDPIVRFHWYMRLLEFGQRRTLLFPFFIIIKLLFLRISRKLGFSIPINTIGKGVCFPHYGTIVVNSRAWIGDGSIVNVDVVIGRHPDSKLAVPKIGKNVYIGPGAKIFGKITIGDGSKVGANAVVNKDFPNSSILVGIPAKNINL